MKKFLLTIVAILSISSCVYASNVNVQLNGENVDFTDENGLKVEAQIVNGRTMVPMRKLFELLGASIDWDGTTQTVTATKNDTTIKLQINNDTAELTTNGASKKTKLDSKPILIDNRTMVPLRFISESLGKQVAWDSANSTAIIIDYDYFSNMLKSKSSLLYKFIENKPAGMTVQISRNYTDLRNSAFNTVSSVYATITNVNENTRHIAIDFTGTSELFKEIANEGWSSISLDVTYTDDGVSILTDNAVLNRMITDKNITYADLGLTGKYNDSLGDAIRNIVGINENEINIGTFQSLKSEFEKFLKLFNASNTNNSSTITANNINYSNANNQYFDYTKFDNIIFDNEFIQTYNFINKLIFNYDVELNSLLYDTSNISVNMNVSDSVDVMSISARIDLSNEFDEKFTYTIEVK